MMLSSRVYEESDLYEIVVRPRATLACRESTDVAVPPRFLRIHTYS